MESSTTSSLEQFRQEWQREVEARRTQHGPSRAGNSTTGEASSPVEVRRRAEKGLQRPSTRHPLSEELVDNGEDSAHATNEASLEPGVDSLRISGDADEDEFARLGRSEPKTALEHYERAVEKEGQGKLGDSLQHYRKAFKLDEKVDQTYKEKHFAHKWKPNRTVLSVPANGETSSNVIQQGARLVESTPMPQTTSQLISTFADCQILNAPPVIEGDVLPPCPIRRLPTEVLLEVLRHIAQVDVSVYSRLASVCRKLAFHVFSESAIWKEVALGSNFGLASQQYHFSTDVQGRPTFWNGSEDDDDDEKPQPRITAALFSPDEDWREVFHSYPRIRFTGVYISTVNYTRPGGASVTPSTWGQQVLIVTYYRYLRFFRDGTVISLLTTHEPLEVVHLLTKENLVYVRTSHGREAPNPMNFATVGHSLSHDRSLPPPTAQNVLKHALRGRWRLCHPSLESAEIGANAAVPGDIHIETEGGAGPRYMYTMHLSPKTGNTRNRNASRNNKLVWKGFWSYNSMTSDWAEFQLRNDKAFWFSRVKSYGLGY